MKKLLLSAILAVGLSGGCQHGFLEKELENAENYILKEKQTCRSKIDLAYRNGRINLLESIKRRNCVFTSPSYWHCKMARISLASEYQTRAHIYTQLNQPDEAIHDLIDADWNNPRVLQMARFWEDSHFKRLEGISGYDALVEKYQKKKEK